jgi:hypothetical protein
MAANKNTIWPSIGEYDTDMNTIWKFCIHIIFWPALGSQLYQITSPLSTDASPGLKLIQKTGLEYMMYCIGEFRSGRNLESV